MINNITSRNNPLIIQTAKLKDKKQREALECFFFEGKKLFFEAKDNALDITDVFVRDDVYDEMPEAFKGFNTCIVSDSVYKKLTDEMAPQGIFCVARRPKIHNFGKEKEASEAVIPSFIVCSVRDPGNLGTIIRCANAFGIERLILSSDCADIYSPKTVRASMGALFRQKISIYPDLVSEINEMKSAGYTVLAATLADSSHMLTEIDIQKNICFAVGNEGHGISQDIIDACSGSVIIPMMPSSESLNVSEAATVLMWEYFKKNS